VTRKVGFSVILQQTIEKKEEKKRLQNTDIASQF